MSYNKRTWATGNVVGAVDLNRIENGIASINTGMFFVETEWNDTKGGFEILTPLADIATATADGRTCKTIGDLYGYQITVGSPPWGGYEVTVDDRFEIQYDGTPPKLIVYHYDWNSTNLVLMEETFSYVLTPAT